MRNQRADAGVPLLTRDVFRVPRSMIAAVAGSAAAGRASSQPPAREAAGKPTFTVALPGDSIITRRLSIYQEPEFLGLVDLIRGADAAFTNLEMLFHDYESYPMHESGGTWMRADPALLK